MPTVYLEVVPEYRDILSSRVRELIHDGDEEGMNAASGGGGEQVGRILEWLVQSHPIWLSWVDHTV